MSIVLPNGSTINLQTITDMEAVAEMLESRAPVVVCSESNGVIEKTVLWDPANPATVAAPVQSYVLPPSRGFFRQLWRRIRSSSIKSVSAWLSDGG